MAHKLESRFLSGEISTTSYADDTTLMAETDELKNLLMRVKEDSEKTSLKLKAKIMASGLITSWQIDGGKVETVTDFLFLDSKITADSDCCHEIKRRLLLKSYDKSAAAAKSLQLCPTLCDPIDGSPSGSSVTGILQARPLEWVAISFSSA